ncbi:MAG: DUF3987 domain-containing protein [Chitinophagaceae bacterium]
MEFNLFMQGIKNLTPSEVKKMLAILTIIRYDVWLKQRTEIFRTLSKDKQDRFKIEEFEYVTWGGIFQERRDDKLIRESGLVCLDLDKLSDPASLKRLLIEKCPYLLFGFISPSGDGLKVVFRCTPGLKFKDNYYSYGEYLLSNFQIPKSSIDYSCVNISRACFLCHDPEAYINPEITENTSIQSLPYLEVIPGEAIPEIIDDEYEETKENIFESPVFLYAPIQFNFENRNLVTNFISLCRVNIKNHGDFVEGNRHNWVLRLASLCNSFGMEKEIAIRHFLKTFKNHPAIINADAPFNKQYDLIKPFDDSYKKYQGEFESWQDNSEFFHTPYLPEEVFNQLPNFIKNLTRLFSDQRERDVFLLGLLTLLSTCFPLLQGVYKQKRVRSNLFLFVSAPAASGKGVISWIEKLGDEIEEAFLDIYKMEMKEYEETKRQEKEENDDEETNQLEIPSLKKLFIAADNTSPQIIANIYTNEVFGIIYDTEADTLTKANKSDHGHFSNVLRQGFHHETIRYERKTNNQRIVIKEPAFSILISGTPGQVKKLVDDVENGLTSRFVFYSYTSPMEWKDVFAAGDDLHWIFKSAAKDLYHISKPFLFDFLANRDREMLFELTGNQQVMLNTWFEDKVKCLDQIYGTDIRGSVLRLGIIFFRIAMILSAVRTAEMANERSLSDQKKIICTDADFNTAKSIIGSLLHHTVNVYTSLQKTGNAKRHRNIKEMYLDKLPATFDREKAMEIASLQQIKEKTAENYLTKFIKDEKVVKIKHNHYQKNIA